MKGIKAITKKNVTEEVFESLLQLIFKNTWVSGEKLPSEKSLCEQFDVSRITIRSALDRLNALGIIETRHGEGSFVKEVTADNFMLSLYPQIVLDQANINELQVMEYRQIVECGTASLAIDKYEESDLDELEELLKEMENSKNDYRQFAISDYKFHKKLATLTRNSLICTVFDMLNQLLQDSVMNIVPAIGTDKGIYYHHKILLALRNKDKEGISSIMHKHIQENIDYLKQNI